MTDLIVRLRATKTFLDGVQGTPAKAHVLQVQATNVSNMLEASALTLDQAAEAVVLIKECGWGEDALSDLIATAGLAACRAENMPDGGLTF